MAANYRATISGGFRPEITFCGPSLHNVLMRALTHEPDRAHGVVTLETAVRHDWIVVGNISLRYGKVVGFGQDFQAL